VAPSVDKELIRARYRRSLPRYDGEAAPQREMARSLVSALRRLGRTDFPRVLEIGCGSGLLTRQIARRLKVRALLANDLNEDCGSHLENTLSPGCGCALRFVGGDIERMEALPADLDLVASNAVFHWLEDPEALLDRLAQALVGGGCLAFTTFGPENLLEIGELTGMRLVYRSADELRRILAKNYRLRYASERRVRLRFDSPRGVLEHLRRTGANSLKKAAWTKGSLQAFEEEYRRRFSLAGGGVSLRYHPLLFVGER
jgi:malonyl-CoA O-methyltransferase